jgi:hypothetical protein
MRRHREAPGPGRTILKSSKSHRLRLSLLAWLTVVVPAVAADRQFEITFSPQVRQQPYSGRVYLYFSKSGSRGEPRFGPNWFDPDPMIAVDIENWKAGEPLSINSAISDWMLAFPRPLADLDLSGYRVQAVARFAPHERVVVRHRQQQRDQPCAHTLNLDDVDTAYPSVES